MPELLEVETYRQVADRTVGRTIVEAVAPDALVVVGADPTELEAALTGTTIVGTRRRGKLAVVDTDGPSLGLHFGMTGRIYVDGVAGIDRLEYSSQRDDPKWDRLILRFDGGGELRLNDARRLGRIMLDPDLDRLGPDAAEITKAQFVDLVAGRDTPIKALLLNQERIAGMGNLLCDEALWRAGIDPARRCRDLSPDEIAELWRQMRSTLRILGRRGGSHTGDTFPERRADGHCPRDGTPLRRATVGGRTTYWCPLHQS